MKIFLKPQVYLFSRWKHKERENTEENGRSITKYNISFSGKKFKKCNFIYIAKQTHFA